jgi:hypothetical protein
MSIFPYLLTFVISDRDLFYLKILFDAMAAIFSNMSLDVLFELSRLHAYILAYIACRERTITWPYTLSNSSFSFLPSFFTETLLYLLFHFNIVDNKEHATTASAPTATATAKA